MGGRDGFAFCPALFGGLEVEFLPESCAFTLTPTTASVAKMAREIRLSRSGPKAWKTFILSHQPDQFRGAGNLERSMRAVSTICSGDALSIL